jgi:nucleoid-associated protein YgaU
MLIAVSKWTLLSVFGGTLLVGSAVGWALRGTTGEAPPLAAVSLEPRDLEGRIEGGVDLPAPGPDGGVFQAASATVAPTPTRGAWFRVGAGDTLSEMSQKAYGTVKRVGDISRANPGLDPRRLVKGTLVYIPVRAEPAPARPGR